ncbi:hypothetical protein GCM10009596_16620 [Arthrobacter rhombi]|uniref:hypothetical protein n=1 Tax=Arthrobacter rhombi TaxID=71253 RepID=UPI0031CEC1D7
MDGLIPAFLRRPESHAERVADGVRILAAASVVAAALGWGWIQFAVFMLALLATLAPRALALPGPLDIAVGITALVAAWSNVLDLYEHLPGWDKFIHGLLGGLVALLAVTLAQRAGSVPAPGDPRAMPMLVSATVAFGLATGAVWEMLEWAGHTYIDPAVHVGYDDTIGDLAADGIGSLVAALLWFPYLRRVGHRHPSGARTGHHEVPRP